MEQEKESNFGYLIYVIAFVAVLIIAAISVSYAYYKVNISSTMTSVNVSVSIDCIDLLLSENGTGLSLSHKYPITDALASTDVTPLTVTVTNNCPEARSYTLALTTLEESSNTTNDIEDSKIRYKVLKNENEYKSADYLSNLSKVSGTNQAYIDLYGTNGTDGEIALKYSGYTIKNIYGIDDTVSIPANGANVYKVYAWVDYYEGDSAMYTDANAVHDTSYDFSTKNKKFTAAVSLSING